MAQGHLLFRLGPPSVRRDRSHVVHLRAAEQPGGKLFVSKHILCAEIQDSPNPIFTEC